MYMGIQYQSYASFIKHVGQFLNFLITKLSSLNFICRKIFLNEFFYRIKYILIYRVSEVFIRTSNV